MAVCMFPGQGAQQQGMGMHLFDDFSDWLARIDAILGYSIKTLCLHDPEQKLSLTEYTQPALYVVNALTYFKALSESSLKPDFLIGHSLGEYNALLAAGVFDFETGLRLVKKRAELMAQASDGGMLAVIGLSLADVEHVLLAHDLQAVVANHNSHTQAVISGPKTVIEAAQTVFEKAGATWVLPLKVSGAFHSPHMASAQKAFESFVEPFEFNPPTIPVIANVTAKPYEFSAITKLLTQQISHRVRFAESIVYLLDQGQDEFQELGPSSVLTGLVKRIRMGQ